MSKFKVGGFVSDGCYKYVHRLMAKYHLGAWNALNNLDRELNE